MYEPLAPSATWAASHGDAGRASPRSRPSAMYGWLDAQRAPGHVASVSSRSATQVTRPGAAP